uniref:Uncharacterized mitochondrial protein AtMg00810-like n=1 Tax=Tanacetum cinerariifolium TaxID=118510 RepID=A0A699H4X1_TANCI|nr:uncharacterized mitochondrial protein AtMg00810-like [Tanacetum cinerariifolium]
MSQLELLEEKLSQEDVNQKLLRLNTTHGVSTASTQLNVAYSKNIDNLSDVVNCSFFACQPNSPQLVHEDLQQIHPYDIEEMDLRWQMAMLTMRARRARGAGFLLGNRGLGCRRGGSGRKAGEEGRVGVTGMALFKRGGKTGYTFGKFTQLVLVIVDNCKKELGYENFNAVPPPYMGNFMPLTPDLSFTGLDEFVNKHVVKNCKAKSSEKEPKRFNSKTRIVEENLHIRFSESTPNVVGTQSNGFAGTKASDNAGQARKEIEPVKYYILLSLWTDDPPFSQDPKSSNDDGSKPSSDDGKKVDEYPRKENECNDQEKEDNVNSTNNVDTVSSTVNTTITNGVNVVDFVVYQMDVKSAFLHGKIEEEVYACQPPGFEDPNFLVRVYKVEKALCGLHQVPRAWYETLSTYLLDNGFQRGKINKTLFSNRHKGDILLVQVYVDDIIFGSTKKKLCIAFERLIHEKFQMSSIGELTFFLGLQVKQKKDGTLISQDKYVAKILKKFGFTKVKTASTPMKTQKPLLMDEDDEEVDVHMYRSMIGSLMYLTSSRPYIMLAVCACARYQVNPKVSHLHAVKGIFRYLKGQPELGLWYPKDSPFDLVAYTNSDYAGASLDRKSTTGGCQFLGCRLISWQCKKLTVVANSTTEAEYVAASNKAVHKEFGDRLVRAATTASSLEAEQDSGNITKTQSKATPNEYSSQGTNSGGGPRCQETIGDTIAQTRFERVSKHSNDSLLARGNTLQSDEDRFKLDELMALCTNL